MNIFVGIDVQLRRGLAVAILDSVGKSIDNFWLDTPSSSQTLSGKVASHLRAFSTGPLSIAIDAPRTPLQHHREWYWDGSRKDWRPRRGTDRGLGRHCEVVIAAHRLANPKWTPLVRDAPPWMQCGFDLFAGLKPFWTVEEVFPTASYAQLQSQSIRVEIDLRGFAQGPKDLLDAYVAAATLREYHQGRGSAVGGGDGLGQIVLPRPIDKPIPRVLAWPSS